MRLTALGSAPTGVGGLRLPGARNLWLHWSYCSIRTHISGVFMPVDYQAIAERAYQLWESRGRPEGEHEQIWIDAERELQQAGSKVAEAGAPQASEPLAAVKPRRL
jgi:hypothetical protein